MQGTFNVDWKNLIEDTELDEETSRLYRQKQDELELTRHKQATPSRRKGRKRAQKVSARLGVDNNDESQEEDNEDEDDDDSDDDNSDKGDDAGSRAGAAGARPQTQPVQPGRHKATHRKDEVHRPPLRFTTQDKQFFVLPGDISPREGIFGHYLRAYTVDEDDECVPFPPPDDYDQNEAKQRDDDFLEAGWPGQPWPDSRLIKAADDAWKAGTDDWLQDIEPAQAGDSEALLEDYKFAASQVKRQDANVPFMIARKAYFDNKSTDKRHLYFNLNGDPSLPPNMDVCVPGQDFVARKNPLEGPPEYYEVGSAFLSRCVEEGELLDFAFAKRMQGLLGVGQDAVWACMDPDFNPADRAGALERFAAAYTASFYRSVSWQDQQDPRAVAIEALQEHKAFCQEWVHKHYRTLTPIITSAAEALVADFYDSTRVWMPAKPWTLSITQLARLLMRHEELSQHFAVCLQTYMTSMDQARPGRNASYKAMNTAAVTRFQSFKRFVAEIQRRSLEVSRVCNELGNLKNFCFHKYLVDWHGIAGQLPETHRFFPRPQDNLLLKRMRNTDGKAREPWLVGRK